MDFLLTTVEGEEWFDIPLNPLHVPWGEISSTMPDSVPNGTLSTDSNVQNLLPCFRMNDV